MDLKIRIHFIPRDSSRVRVISFSRKLGVAVLGTMVPLCLLGFWLALSGSLRENPARRAERRREARENQVLRERVVALERGNAAIDQSLDSLESARINALFSAGLETPETPRVETHSGLYRLFHFGDEDRNADLNRALSQAQRASLFFDSSLFVLARHRDLASLMPTSYPVNPRALVIRPFGMSLDPFTERRSMHGGVDFSLRPGAPVYAAGGGVVTEADQDPVWGWCVRVRHTARIETFYAHLQQLRVTTGESVVRGQILGTIGQSGAATGPHLHFEMLINDERVDPLRYLFPTGPATMAGLEG